MVTEKVYPKIFMWMFIGLLITFLTGYIVSINENMLYKVFSGAGCIILAIIEIALVIFLSARIKKMKPMTAKISFILYSFVSGLTFSAIFVTYELTSIIFVFGITAFLFGIFALLGYVLKIDLSKFGIFLLMALLGIIVCGILSIFIQNETFNFIITAASLLIFLAYIVYDINRIKNTLDEFTEEDNLAIFGALQLYLDFINVMIRLLEFFGKRRD